MKNRYYQEDVDEWVRENGEKEAALLLEQKLPGYSKKLDRLDKRIRKLLDEIKEVFSDAEYYTSGGDGFALVLGSTHSDDLSCSPQYQRVAWNGVKAHISSGDW